MGLDDAGAGGSETAAADRGSASQSGSGEGTSTSRDDRPPGPDRDGDDPPLIEDDAPEAADQPSRADWLAARAAAIRAATQHALAQPGRIRAAARERTATKAAAREAAAQASREQHEAQPEALEQTAPHTTDLPDDAPAAPHQPSPADRLAARAAAIRAATRAATQHALAQPGRIRAAARERTATKAAAREAAAQASREQHEAQPEALEQTAPHTTDLPDDAPAAPHQPSPADRLAARAAAIRAATRAATQHALAQPGRIRAAARERTATKAAAREAAAQASRQQHEAQQEALEQAILHTADLPDDLPQPEPDVLPQPEPDVLPQPEPDDLSQPEPDDLSQPEPGEGEDTPPIEDDAPDDLPQPEPDDGGDTSPIDDDAPAAAPHPPLPAEESAKRALTPVLAATRDALARPGRMRAAARERTAAKASAREAAAQASRQQQEAQRQYALEQEALHTAARRRVAQRRRFARLVAKDNARRTRRRRLFLAVLMSPIVVAVGLATAAYYVDSIPAPAELSLPESTTIYFSDGTTPIAKIGADNRTILSFDEMNDAVTQAIVAAEDRSFWTNGGVDFTGVARAAWNNVRGGSTQGASTITQQYVRVAAGLSGITYARKTREAILAWKMDRTYPKEKILESYLNTVPFGRGAYGIEAAAQAFFGKTAKRTAPAAQQVTVAEAMVLASMVKQPEPDPADPVGHPGYDPARGGTAAANALMRWQYVRDGMVSLGYLTDAEAAALEFPHTVRALVTTVQPDGPTGLIVNHVLSELWHSEPFAGEAPDYIRNGGFRIVTTVDKRAQDAAEAAADIRRVTAPAPVRNQPADWQAALVAVQPGTGRVLAYYGGSRGTGADYAGWYYEANGDAVGYGQHPPGSSFKVYDLAEALRQGIPLSSHWDSPAVKDFPASGRTKASRTGPVRNSSTDPCQPDCTLAQATVASLNVPFFDLTERIGAANVIDMAARAGIDSMWTDRTGQQGSERIDLHAHAAKDLVGTTTADRATKPFSTEVGIGQYGITVLDHANGMATFAAGGERAQAHFVRSVYRHGDLVYSEQLTQNSIGISKEQVDELTAVLGQVPSAKLNNGWDAAGKTGTWEAGTSTTANAHTWMVGYTNALAAAVWLGTTDGAALTTSDGKHDVFGSTHPAAIWRQFMIDATAAMGLDPHDSGFSAVNAVTSPTPTATPKA